jgi:hypothetical protein
VLFDLFIFLILESISLFQDGQVSIKKARSGELFWDQSTKSCITAALLLKPPREP